MHFVCMCIYSETQIKQNVPIILLRLEQLIYSRQSFYFWICWKCHAFIYFSASLNTLSWGFKLSLVTGILTVEQRYHAKLHFLILGIKIQRGWAECVLALTVNQRFISADTRCLCLCTWEMYMLWQYLDRNLASFP